MTRLHMLRVVCAVGAMILGAGQALAAQILTVHASGVMRGDYTDTLGILGPPGLNYHLAPFTMDARFDLSQGDRLTGPDYDLLFSSYPYSPGRVVFVAGGTSRTEWGEQYAGISTSTNGVDDALNMFLLIRGFAAVLSIRDPALSLHLLTNLPTTDLCASPSNQVCQLEIDDMSGTYPIHIDLTGGVFARFDPGTGAGGVPEPAGWMLLIAGLGATGAALRRRRGIAASA